MRFKKGSKVEVLSKKEFPSGAWRIAEIISGNGHHYSVRYDQSLSDGDEPIVERVSRKAIRPCPSVRGPENWVTGDIVEVFDNNLWKIAKVLRAVGRKYFFVRLLGCFQEIGVHKSDIRVRQSWKDNRWVVIGKNSRCREDREAEKLPTEKYYQKPKSEVLQQDVNVKACVGNDHFPVENVVSFKWPLMASSRSKKRGSEFCSPHVGTLMEAGWKKRAIEKEGRHQQLFAGHPSQLLEKVDAVASPQTLLGENYMHASFNNRMTGFSEIGMEKGKPNDDERYFIPTSLEPNDAESGACCSVASCGSNNRGPYMLPHHFITDTSLDTDSQSDDAESSSGREYGRRCSFPTKEDLSSEIHKLELHAYRFTMEALYASGPLSWEQEAMMTNLRLTLHISNDEHLLELRHLVSTETAY